MTAIPTKLYDAFEKIRLGKVNEGVKLFDRVDGFEGVKAIALAELAYFRHDWKNGISFAQDIFQSGYELLKTISSGRSYKIFEFHFELFLLATCQLGCWKESRNFMEQLIRERENETKPMEGLWGVAQIISQLSDSQNTTKMLLESRPKLRTNGDEKLLGLSERRISSSKTRSYCKNWYHPDALIDELFRKAKTEDHITFYEKYIQRFESTEIHAGAAKSYIALGNLPEAQNAIRRYVSCWEYKEPLQTEPILLFADHEFWTVMSNQHFTESLLTIPHNNES
ncbi:MAG: hypothetical protein LBJ00_13830 [Planctomycetaceae bacterium]|jgi:hypothetical protein|nr:hypothetical protein [Planctomycetaceae bacterium]